MSHKRFAAILIGSVSACLFASISLADEPRYVLPGNGLSSAVVVPDRPLAHTGQIFPRIRVGEGKAPQLAAQLHQVLDQLGVVLSHAHSGLDRIVKLNIYVTKDLFVRDVYRVLAKRFPAARRPAVSLVVTRLPHVGVLVAADAVAMTSETRRDSVRIVTRSVRQNPITRVSEIPQGVRIYVSGQAARTESLAEATRKTLEGLHKTLRFLGRGKADIVQLKAFLSPMSDAAKVRHEVATFFGKQPPPPLVLVEWKSSKTVPIEIELVAWGGQNSKGASVEYLTPPGMKASAVFSRVARINHTKSIYISGLYSATRSAAPASTADSAENEVKDIFGQLQTILKHSGSDLKHLVKATYYVSNADASRKLGQLRPDYYDPRRPPAASKTMVYGVGQAARGLSIDIIAVPAAR